MDNFGWSDSDSDSDSEPGPGPATHHRGHCMYCGGKKRKIAFYVKNIRSGDSAKEGCGLAHLVNLAKDESNCARLVHTGKSNELVRDAILGADSPLFWRPWPAKKTGPHVLRLLKNLSLANEAIVLRHWAEHLPRALDAVIGCPSRDLGSRILRWLEYALRHDVHFRPHAASCLRNWTGGAEAHPLVSAFLRRFGEFTRWVGTSTSSKLQRTLLTMLMHLNCAGCRLLEPGSVGGDGGRVAEFLRECLRSELLRTQVRALRVCSRYGLEGSLGKGANAVDDLDTMPSPEREDAALVALADAVLGGIGLPTVAALLQSGATFASREAAMLLWRVCYSRSIREGYINAELRKRVRRFWATDALRSAMMLMVVQRVDRMLDGRILRKYEGKLAPGQAPFNPRVSPLCSRIREEQVLEGRTPQGRDTMLVCSRRGRADADAILAHARPLWRARCLNIMRVWREAMPTRELRAEVFRMVLRRIETHDLGDTISLGALSTAFTEEYLQRQDGEMLFQITSVFLDAGAAGVMHLVVRATEPDCPLLNDGDILSEGNAGFLKFVHRNFGKRNGISESALDGFSETVGNLMHHALALLINQAVFGPVGLGLHLGGGTFSGVPGVARPDDDPRFHLEPDDMPPGTVALCKCGCNQAARQQCTRKHRTAPTVRLCLTNPRAERQASLRCSRCLAVYYVDASHQKAHWKKHKKTCRAPPAASA